LGMAALLLLRKLLGFVARAGLDGSNENSCNNGSSNVFPQWHELAFNWQNLRMKVRLLSVGRHRQNCWHIPCHRHSFYEMVVFLAGGGGVRSGKDEFGVGVGDTLLFRPGEGHEEWVVGSEPLESVFIGFEGDGLESVPGRVFDADGRLRLLAEWLHSLRDQPGAEGRTAQQAFHAALVAEYERLGAQKESVLVERVREYVRRHLAEPITLGRLATFAAMSPFHFIRCYRQQSGHTPMADVRRMRAEQARDLVLTTGQPLKAIAPQVGIPDEYALYRLFRRQFGRTPGQFRRSSPLPGKGGNSRMRNT